MLGVRLREHHELDVARVARHGRELRGEVVDLVRREREPELGVRALERRRSAAQNVDDAHRSRLVRGEELLLARHVVEQRLGHPIVEQRRDLCAPRGAQRAVERELDEPAALDAMHRQVAEPRDVRRLRRPRRDRPEPRHDVETLPRAGEIERAAAIVEQRLEHASLGAVEQPLEVDEMLEAHRRVGDRRFERAQLGP